MNDWTSQKQAEALYMKGGLAAVYPDVYGAGGIYERSNRTDWPKDRFKPAKDFKPHYHPPYTGWDQYEKGK